MVNPGAFLGSRKVFLEAQMDLYAEAVTANHVADTVADIQRRYFKRYPITLPHDQEPTDEWLEKVDDDAPDSDIRRPEIEDSDYETYSPQYHTMLKDIRLRKEQIKRRLQYQHSKARDEKVTLDKGAADPMAILVAKLTGENIKKPRMKTAYNLWGPEHRYFVDPIFKQRVEKDNVPARGQAALRSAIYKELFDELPEDERLEWVARAENDHRAALQEIDEKLKAGPSTTPEARQRVIQALPKFIEPILDLIADHTGWKVTLIAGGPEPADGGRLNMVSVHSGLTSGPVKVDFGRSERQAYKNYVIPTFGTFLKKCYSIEECRSRALVGDNQAIKLATMGIEEDLDVHRFDIDFAHYNAAKSLPPKFRSQKSNVKTASVTSNGSASTGSATGSARSSTAGSAPSTVKYGPPIGRKKLPLRPLPSKRAATSTLGNASSATLETPSNGEIDAMSLSISITPAPLLPANTGHPSFDNGPLSTLSMSAPSRAPSPAQSHAPLPAPSRVPSPVPSRAPSPAPSRAPSPAPSRAPSPVLSRAPSPAPAHSLLCPETPVPVTGPAREPTLACSHINTPSQTPEHPQDVPTLSDSGACLSPTSSSCIHPLIPPVSPQSSVSQGSGSRLLSVIGPVSLPDIQPSIGTTAMRPRNLEDTLLSPSYTPSPAYTPPPVNLQVSALPSPQREIQQGILKPSGAATVPDPSFFILAAGSTAKSRKRKGTKAGGDTTERASKRTRSSVSMSDGKRKAPDQDAGPVKKKQRHSDNIELSTGAFQLTTSDAHPPWLIKAINLITAVDLGPQWRRFATMWIEFEEMYEFKQNGSQLGSHSRPRAVAEWIQRARNSNYRPNIKNTKTFEAEFRCWWTSLQPDWRCVEGSEVLERRDGEDWEVLRCSGQNGLLSVIAALFFWGLAVKDSTSAMKLWVVVLDDVLYALTQLVG